MRITFALLLVLTVLVLLRFTASARADIYQWEYVNPADPSQGRMPSSMLCPDGAGVSAAASANLAGLNLTKAYLKGASLSYANLQGTKLINADLSFFGGGYEMKLSNADLSNANLYFGYFVNADLTGANFSGADVRNGAFGKHPLYPGTGITAAQLYSTASYQSHDLNGIQLDYIDVSGWNFSRQNLTSASFDDGKLVGTNFSNADLTGALLWRFIDMSNANFSNANLARTNFLDSTLAGANFTGAHLDGTYLSGVTDYGFTASQLYSTASYQQKNLKGIVLTNNELGGWNFSGQNLANANFGKPYVGAANGSVGTSYLGDVNFRGANLTGASFVDAYLDSRSFFDGGHPADFTDAIIQGADFSATWATPDPALSAKIYSTASYKAHDLRGIHFGERVLNGWNLAGQNLTNGDFTNATFTGADLTAADMRGAQNAQISDAVTKNMIGPDGHIDGLDLVSGSRLDIRNYHGDPTRTNSLGDPNPVPLTPVHVDLRFDADSTCVLRFVLDGDSWDSIVSFSSGIPVTRDGTLSLTFADGVNVSQQLGRTFNLFDWTGVAPTGAFNLASPYVWDLSKLYTTGRVTMLATSGLPGDFNSDGRVDAADYLAWRKGLGTTYSAATLNIWRASFGTKTGLPGDFNNDGVVNASDYVVWRKGLGTTYASTDLNTWRANFGVTLGVGSGAAMFSGKLPSAAVPEPSAVAFMVAAILGLIGFMRRRYK
jgi:uncharacterized protein YjbI with pentapeptide repeats